MAPLIDKLEMIRPSRERVTLPPLPEGYRLRIEASVADPRYEQLYATAFDHNRFSEIPDKLLPYGCFIIEHMASGALAASCLAFRGHRPPRHDHAGQLAYLMVDPAHARSGLGTIAAAAVTNRLVEDGYAKPFLRTDDDRLAAIAIYLKLGWVPSLYTPEMPVRWEAVRRSLIG